jgi:hypothetical protein
MISPAAEFRPNLIPIFETGAGCRGLHMTSKNIEIAIEEIIAACDGGMRGALEACLLVNEHLETELLRLHAALSQTFPLDQGFKTLH